MSTINLVSNPRAKNNTAGWVQSASGLSASRTTLAAAEGGATPGGQIRFTATGSASAQGINFGVTGQSVIVVQPSVPYTFQWFWRGSKAFTTAVAIVFFDANGTQLSNPGANLGALPTQYTPNPVPVTVTSPANAATAQIQWNFSGSWVTGDYVEITMLLGYQGSGVTTYFDGSTPPNATYQYAWYGAPDASQSARYTSMGTAIGYTDMSPCPRAVISFTDMHPLAVTADVYRIAGTDDPVIIPGGDTVSALGGQLVRTDYYAPFGIPIQYRAESFDASGTSLGYTAVASITLPVAFTLLSSPYDPKLCVVIDPDENAAAELTNPALATVHEFQGRRIVLVESQLGLDQVDMSFWTDTLQQDAAVRSIFKASGNFVVIRTPPPMPVPRVMYAYGTPKRSDTNLPGGFEEFFWNFIAQEVSSPSTVLLVSVNTYNLYTSYYPTYSAFKAANLTYRDALINQPPAN